MMLVVMGVYIVMTIAMTVVAVIVIADIATTSGKMLLIPHRFIGVTRLVERRAAQAMDILPSN
jgi:hypothetical protein